MPLFQSEFKCETILMKMTLICMKMKLHAELKEVTRHKGTRKWPVKNLYSLTQVINHLSHLPSESNDDPPYLLSELISSLWGSLPPGDRFNFNLKKPSFYYTAVENDINFEPKRFFT